MRRKLQSRKKSNKGFSLVEVLVAMLVIAVASIPIIKSFTTTARINARAKRIQNATDIAQNLSEEFTSRTMTFINDKYTDCTVSTDGKVRVYNNIYCKGEDGGDYYVTAVMDSKRYTGYDLPELKNLFGTGAATTLNEITRYDKRALIEIAEQSGNSAVTSADIKKTTTVHIDTKFAGEYNYYLEIKYEYRYNPSIKYEPDTDKLGITNGKLITGQTQFPNFYIMYEPYDVSGMYKGYADDEINIAYTNDNATDTRPVNVYLIQQDTKYVDTDGNVTDNLIKVKDENIHVWNNGSHYNDDDQNKKMTFYSNGTQTITVGENRMVRLYGVDFYVYYEEEDPNDPKAYIDGDADTSDVFATVSTAREE